MNRMSSYVFLSFAAIFLIITFLIRPCSAGEMQNMPKAFIDGTSPDWRSLGEDDFVNVNCYRDTWTWKNGFLFCSGEPIGVMRTRRTFVNFELVVEWRHMRPAGNSGTFVWVPGKALEDLKPGEVSAPLDYNGLIYLFQVQAWLEEGGWSEQERLAAARAELERRKRYEARDNLLDELVRASKVQLQIRHLGFHYLPESDG